MRWLAGLLLALTAGAASAQVVVDRVSVTVEKRNGIDWCVLEAQVSGEVSGSVEALAAVIQDYPSYPRLFPRIREVGVEQADGEVLLSETLVVDVLGIHNVNRFTLRLRPLQTATTFGLSWVQDRTDGSIESVEGAWTLEERKSGDRPVTWVKYQTRSAVPMKAFGQDILLRMFLGGETRDLVEAVARAARQKG